MKKLKFQLDIDFQLWVFGLAFKLENKELAIACLCFQLYIERVPQWQ